jgi:hypothetical protein
MRRGLSVHRSTKFLLVTATKGRTTQAVVPVWRAPAETLEAGASDGVLTPDLLRRLSATTGDPRLHSRLDRRDPRRSRRASRARGSDGWHAHFGRELNATEDKGHFVCRADGLPVLEGKTSRPLRCASPARGARIRADVAGTAARPRPGGACVSRRWSGRTAPTLIAASLPARTVDARALCLRTPPAAATVLVRRVQPLVANYTSSHARDDACGCGTVERLRVPRPPTSSVEFDHRALVERLERTAGEDGEAYIDLQRRRRMCGSPPSNGAKSHPFL